MRETIRYTQDLIYTRKKARPSPAFLHVPIEMKPFYVPYLKYSRRKPYEFRKRSSVHTQPNCNIFTTDNDRCVTHSEGENSAPKKQWEDLSRVVPKKPEHSIYMYKCICLSYGENNLKSIRETIDQRYSSSTSLLCYLAQMVGLIENNKQPRLTSTSLYTTAIVKWPTQCSKRKKLQGLFYFSYNDDVSTLRTRSV